MRTTRPIIVALEGIDGAGKSTLAEQLMRLDWGAWRIAYCKTPANQLHNVCFSVRGINPEASFLAFMIGNVAAIDAYTNTNVLIVDRYLLSTIVHHQGPYALWKNSLPSLVSAMKFLLPDLTVLLCVDTRVAHARLSQRLDDRPLLISLESQKATFEEVLADPATDGMFGKVLVLPNESEEHQREALHTIKREVQAAAS